jgi:RecA-family ATPase
MLGNLLPTEDTEAEFIDPKKLFIFANTKVGKTSAAIQLPNSLVIDFEDGTGYEKGKKINIRKIAKDNNITPEAVLREVLTQLKENVKINNGKSHYDFIIIDTTTALEDMARRTATAMYKASPLGKNFTGNDVVVDLANGAG